MNTLIAQIAERPYSNRRVRLFLFLSGLFLTNALLAEIVGVKIFSLEKMLGLPPAQLNLLLAQPLDFNLTTGVVLWPIVFVTSDIINEYFGKSGVRFISFLTAGLIAFAFVMISVTTLLPPADFWLQINATSPSGKPFNIDEAFGIIFRQGLGIIIGSLTAFLIGQLLDAWVFHRLRLLTSEKKLWLRATGSTLVSQLVDSFVVLIIAFYLFGNWSFEQVISVSIINYIYKFVVALAMTPVLYLAHNAIDRYLAENKKQPALEELTA